jgi:ribosomal protein S18 acetylase RimI-like enzyme
MNKSSWMRRLALTCVLLGLLSGIGYGVYWYACLSSRVPVYEFDPKRDTKPILDIFERDWYWLVANDDYSPEFMLEYRAPKQDPLFAGRMRIKVLREKDQFVGFAAYYMKNNKLGFLNFVDINPEFRGKRYAEQLVRYAINDMKSMGAQRIDLVTRPSNVSAQALYKRLGFILTGQDPDFVFYTLFLRSNT